MIKYHSLRVEYLLPKSYISLALFLWFEMLLKTGGSLGMLLNLVRGGWGFSSNRLSSES